MPWDGAGNFSRTDGTRTGAQTWTEADAAAVGIESDDHDVHDQDIADGIEACLAKNGENSASLLVMAGELKLEGNQLRFDADEDTHFAAGSDDILIGTVGGASVFQLSNTGSALTTLQVRSNDAGADVAPSIVTYRDSASPADDDLLGEFRFDGEDDGSTQTTYAAWRGRALDVTDATEDGAIEAYCMTGGSLTRMLRLSGTTARVISEDAGASEGPSLVVHRDSASPAASDIIGEFRFDGEDSAGNQDIYAAIRGQIIDPTSASEDGQINFHIAIAGSLTQIMELRTTSGTPQLRLSQSEDGAGEGPYLTGRRVSASPAASDDILTIQGVGKNDAAEDITYGKIGFEISDPTDGAEEGIVTIHAYDGGALTEFIRFTNGQVQVGKTTPGISTQGFQAGVGGIIMATAAGAPGRFNRTGNDGQLLIFYRDASEVGDITVTTGTVTLTGFTGAHSSIWAEEPEEDPPVGTLVSVAEGEHKPNHPKVRIANIAEDRRVYGVFAGRKESGALQIHASGIANVLTVGMVYAGDLLTSSEIPGVAMRQIDDVVRSSTVGKVTQGDAHEGERLVPCVLYCGG